MLGAAFTPDGRQLAVQVSTTVSVVDVTDRRADPRPLAELAPTERLAGTGAFTPDGSRFGLVHLACADPCIGDDAHRWTPRLRDTVTGAVVAGPAFATIDGSDVRLVGWQRDGTAVVVRSRADSGMDVLALPPGGANTALLLSPDKEIRGVDVATDLILDGRFGGSAPDPGILPVAHWVPVLLVVTVAVGGLMCLVVRLRRSARVHRSERGRRFRNVVVAAAPGGDCSVSDNCWEPVASDFVWIGLAMTLVGLGLRYLHAKRVLPMQGKPVPRSRLHSWHLQPDLFEYLFAFGWIGITLGPAVLLVALAFVVADAV
jgi:hypothetical protein